MIKTFADKHTRDLFITGKSKKFQPNILKRAIRRLEYIDFATCIEDLKVPPSNHLHALKDNREGQYPTSLRFWDNSTNDSYSRRVSLCNIRE